MTEAQIDRALRIATHKALRERMRSISFAITYGGSIERIDEAKIVRDTLAEFGLKVVAA